MADSSYIFWQPELTNSVIKTMSSSQKVSCSTVLEVSPLDHLKLKTRLTKTDSVPVSEEQNCHLKGQILHQAKDLLLL